MEKQKLLYLGNKLESRGKNPTGVDFLSPLLREETEVISGSTILNPVLRLIDMVRLVIYNLDASVILVDTYSGLAFWYTFTLSVLCQLLGLKYVLILHGGNLPWRAAKSPHIFYFVCSNAHGLVCPSDYLADSLGLKYKLTVIPNFINLFEYTFSHRKSVRVPKLLWVRSFSEIYNPSMAIEILNGLRSFEGATLTMVGPDSDGTMSKVKEKVAQENLIDKVSFAGRLTKAQWRELSTSHNIFINTTNIDNTPVSVIEALSLGMIVLSTNVGGMPYLIEDGVNGFLFKPNDSQSFIDQIIRLTENPKIVEEVSKSARISAEKFDAQVIKKKWQYYLENL